MHPQVNVFLYSNYMYSVIDIPELFDQVLAFLIISLHMVDGYFFQEIGQPFVKPVKAVLACIPTCIKQIMSTFVRQFVFKFLFVYG